jgi:carbonic anhydrase/acetyltransferase-like protein (isoleucine patch superfamily)
LEVLFVIVVRYLDYMPRIDASVKAEPWAAVIGRAQVGAGCRLGRLVTMRADGERIEIGPDCWFGDFSTVHIADSVYPSLVGARVTVGRYGLVHACAVADDCVIGEHSLVMDGSQVGPGSVIAAESVVPPGKTLAGGWLYAGSPARPVEEISPERLALFHRALRGGGDDGVPEAALVRAKNPLNALHHAPGTGPHESEGAYIAPSASLVGSVELAPTSSIWFSCEVDAGAARVILGPGSNIQDNSRVYAGGVGEDVRIGSRVTVGHNVRMEACEIEANVVIGMGSIIGKGTVVREGAVVAAGSITAPGTVVEAGHIWSGRPAVAARPLSDQNRIWFAAGVDVYIGYTEKYLRVANTQRAA